ncbi:MAG: MurR/RpiR family transcriptional regulator [Candidatus Caldatribacteriota bacterium]
MVERGEDFIKKVKENNHKLNSRQKKIIKFILENYAEVGFMSATKIAKKVDTSQSTILRLASALGYDGFGEMQSDIQAMIRRKITSATFVDEMETSYVGSNLKNINQYESLFTRVIQLDLENIKNIKKNIDFMSLVNVVDNILKAKNIYVLGLRSSASLALFFGFSLNLILNNNIKVLDNKFCNLVDQILLISKKDILISFCFARYTKETVKMIRFAKEKEAKTIVFADDILIPFGEICDILIPVNVNSAGYVGSYVGPLSLINFLLALTAFKMGKNAITRLKEVEKYFKEYDVFYS